jgi:hypothetical protein
MLTKQVTASTASDYRLLNFSMECACGKNHVFRTLNQMIRCSCNKELTISSSMKSILIRNGSAKPINN